MKAILAKMANEKDSTETQEESCKALSGLARGKGNSAVIAGRGGVDTVIDGITRHGESPKCSSLNARC